MPTGVQLGLIDPVEGDGASVVPNDDGSTQTSWPDGTVRIDEADGTVMVAFPDFSVLNIQSDGTRTLNDVNGTPLDPATGEPLSGPLDEETPTPLPTTVEELSEILEGGASAIADLAGAKGILRAFGVTAVVDKQYAALSELAMALGEGLKGELSPANWFMQPLKMLLAVIKAIETEERGAAMRSWCYTMVYDAMGMGSTPEPTFSGSLGGPDQDALDQKWWDDARKEAEAQLADGQTGSCFAQPGNPGHRQMRRRLIGGHRAVGGGLPEVRRRRQRRAAGRLPAVVVARADRRLTTCPT
jgi:hypothetical protein